MADVATVARSATTHRLRRPGAPRAAGAAFWALPALIFLVVGAVALPRKPLFRDETATYLFSRLSVPDLFRATDHVDAAFRPYYLLVHVTPGVDTHPQLLRIWSLVFAVGTVAVVASTAALLWNRWVGLVAGLALTANGAFLTAADTARPAPIAMFFCAVATYLLVRSRSRPATWPVVVGYAVSVALAGLFTLFSLLILGAHLVLALAWFVRSDRDRLGAFTVAALAGVAGVVPLVVSSTGQRAQVNWITASSLSDAVRITEYQSGVPAGSGRLLLLVALIVVLIACVVAPRTAAVQATGAVLLIVPALGLWVASGVIQPLELPRYLVVAPIGSALVIAAAVHAVTVPALRLRDRRSAQLATAVVAVASLLIVVAACLPLLRTRFSTASLDRFPLLVARLDTVLRPGDHVIFAQSLQSQGRVAGIALYAGDTDLLSTLSRLAVHEAPLLVNRVVVGTDPFRTISATTPRGVVWVAGGPTTAVNATTDPNQYWYARLRREGCSPLPSRLPRSTASLGLSRWSCRGPIDDATLPGALPGN